MAGGDTNSGISNGYPLKAQLQIIGNRRSYILLFTGVITININPCRLFPCQCYRRNWKKTRRTGLVPVLMWKWRWTANPRRRRNAATRTAPNGNSRSLCKLKPFVSYLFFVTSHRPRMESMYLFFAFYQFIFWQYPFPKSIHLSTKHMQLYSLQLEPNEYARFNKMHRKERYKTANMS